MKRLRRGPASIVGSSGACNQFETWADRVNSRKLFWLVVCALVSAGLYLWLALRYPLAPSLANPRGSWVSMVDPTWVNAALHLCVYLGLTLLYLAIIRLLAPQEGSGAQPGWQIGLICVTWLICSGLLMAAAPAGESHDIFDYLFRGRMMVEYEANPLGGYAQRTLNLSTPFARYLAWHRNVDTYGPVWEAASALVATSVRQAARWLGWWDETYPVCPKSAESCRLLMAYITGYRLQAIILTGISGWLVANMVRRSQPLLVPLALAVWLLNPLTLVASALGGHNDAVMLALVLLGWWLLQRQSPFLALMALFLAAHVKLTALIWLPTCGVWILWRWGWRTTLKVGLAGLGSGIALSWLLYAPYGGWQSLPRMLQERSAYLANSPWRILKTLLQDSLGWSADAGQPVKRELAKLAFRRRRTAYSPVEFLPAAVPLAGHLMPHEGADQKLWRALLAISILYLVLGSFWFQHWYILWVIAPAALLPNSRFTRSILPWLGFGALSANLAMGYFSTTILKTSQPILAIILVVVMIWGPAAIAAIVQYLPRSARSI